MTDSSSQNIYSVPPGLEWGQVYHIAPFAEDGEHLGNLCITLVYRDNCPLQLLDWDDNYPTLHLFQFRVPSGDDNAQNGLFNSYSNDSISPAAGGSNSGPAVTVNAGSLSAVEKNDDGTYCIYGLDKTNMLTAPENFQAGGPITYAPPKPNKNGQKWKFVKPTVGFVDVGGFDKFKNQ